MKHIGKCTEINSNSCCIWKKYLLFFRYFGIFGDRQCYFLVFCTMVGWFLLRHLLVLLAAICLQCSVVVDCRVWALVGWLMIVAAYTRPDTIWYKNFLFVDRAFLITAGLPMAPQKKKKKHNFEIFLFLVHFSRICWSRAFRLHVTCDVRTYMRHIRYSHTFLKAHTEGVVYWGLRCNRRPAAMNRVQTFFVYLSHIFTMNGIHMCCTVWKKNHGVAWRGGGGVWGFCSSISSEQR